jgi:hypothetical protein
MRLLGATLIIAGLCVSLAGCGSKHDNRVAVHPVEGKVLVAGKPAVDAVITLYAADAELARVRPHARVEADGSFHLSTFKTRDGAPVGDFAVTVVWPGPRLKGQGDDEDGPDRLMRRYADSKRPAATVHIAADTKELSPIDLKSPEGKPGKTSRPEQKIEE